VYCFEGVDHTARVSALTLPRPAALIKRVDDETGQVNLHANGLAEAADLNPLYRPTPPTATAVELTTVPYFQWGNRGLADMTVWIRESVTPSQSRHNT
jgi:DUF1680 family protein